MWHTTNQHLSIFRDLALASHSMASTVQSQIAAVTRLSLLILWRKGNSRIGPSWLFWAILLSKTLFWACQNLQTRHVWLWNISPSLRTYETRCEDRNSYVNCKWLHCHVHSSQYDAFFWQEKQSHIFFLLNSKFYCRVLSELISQRAQRSQSVSWAPLDHFILCVNLTLFQSINSFEWCPYCIKPTGRGSHL